MRKDKLLALIKDMNKEDPHIQQLSAFLSSDEIKSLNNDDNILFATFKLFLTEKISSVKKPGESQSEREYFCPPTCLTFHTYVEMRKPELASDDELSALPAEMRVKHIFPVIAPQDLNQLAKTSRLFNKESSIQRQEYWREKFIEQGFDAEELDIVFKSRTINGYSKLFDSFMRVFPKPKWAKELLCLSGDLQAIEYAFEKLGVDIKDYMTIRYVCLSGDLNAINLMIEKGMPLSIQHKTLEDEKDHMLSYALQSGNKDVFEAVYTYMKNSQARLGMHEMVSSAALSGSLEVVKLAIEKADKFIKDMGWDKKGETVINQFGLFMLEPACLSGNVVVFKYILKLLKDEKVMISDNTWEKCLLNAAQSNSMKMLNKVLDAWSKLSFRFEPQHVRGPYGRTPLLLAASSGSISCVEGLLEMGFDENQNDIFQVDLLAFAACSGNVLLTKKIINMDFDLQRTDKDGMDFYHWAPFSGCVGMINLANELGMTSIHPDKDIAFLRFAIKSGNPRAVERMCEIYKIAAKEIMDNKETIEEATKKVKYPSMKLFVSKLIENAEKELSVNSSVDNSKPSPG